MQNMKEIPRMFSVLVFGSNPGQILLWGCDQNNWYWIIPPVINNHKTEKTCEATIIRHWILGNAKDDP